MSLVITVYGEEGIVMAGDSRTTISGRHTEGDQIIQDFAIHYTESANKVFLCPNHAGISVCNEASHNGKPLTGYIESFILSELSEDTPISELPIKLINFMEKLLPIPNTNFHIAGYEKINGLFEPKVWNVALAEKKIAMIDADVPGAIWSGESDILARLITPTFTKDKNGELCEIKTAAIPWGLFTLQDSVDFATYAIRTTIDTMRFQLRPKTVGGPIDILVLKPNEGFWAKKKTLEVE